MGILRRVASSAPTADPEQEVGVFLDEAHRLLDYQWRRADAFERKSLGVLAFTSVVVALLTANLKVILDLDGPWRVAGLSVGAAALLALLSSATTATGALRARDSKSVSVDDVRKAWQRYLTRMETGGGYSDAWHTAGLKRDLVEMLLHGTEEKLSPVQSLREDADRRGRWFTWAIRMNVAALILILVLTVITIVGTLS